MKLKFLYYSFFLFFLQSCAQNNFIKTNKVDKKIYYESLGFALIYDDTLFANKTISKKINNSEIYIMHDFLKKNTPIRLTNPANSKSIETVVHKNANFPKIFNTVISKKIATILDIDPENPYIELIEF